VKQSSGLLFWIAASLRLKTTPLFEKNGEPKSQPLFAEDKGEATLFSLF
jgi:hypothetical protein